MGIVQLMSVGKLLIIGFAGVPSRKVMILRGARENDVERSDRDFNV